MKSEYLEIPLIKDEAVHQFQIKVGDYKSWIVYKERGSKITLIHTETETELEGKGAATAIIEKTLNYLEQNNYTLVPICPMVVAYIKKHPEWMRIVDKSFQGFDK